MGIIDRELAKLGHALRVAPQGRYQELYAAQQALSWALDPQCFKSPAAMLTGTLEDEADCPECHNQPRSGDICIRSET